MRVVGLDLSLTSTGIASITDVDVQLQRIVSKGSKDATLDQRHTRLHNLCLDISLAAHDADLVVIEGPSYGQHRQSGQHDRAGLWWMVVDFLASDPQQGFDLEVVEVPPATRCKYATGKGNAPKDHVLACTVRRYPAVAVDGNDTADALILAAMGMRALGHPLEERLPQNHIDAMAKVAWPRPEAAS